MFSSRSAQPPQVRLAAMAQSMTELRGEAFAADSAVLEAMRDEAAKLRHDLDQLDGALLVALTRNDPDVPQGLDLSLRVPFWQTEALPGAWSCPGNGTYLAAGMTLFHDCPLAEIGLRQAAQATAAPFGLELDVFGFEGTYLSIAVDLPAHCATGLTTDHILQVDTQNRRDPERAILVRLNIQAGPNTVQMLRTLSGEGETGSVEFDLAYSEIGDSPAEKLWLDILFENPAYSRAKIADMWVTRRRRAEI